MHTVVIRREVYQKYPWVAQSLYKAFVLGATRGLSGSLSDSRVEIHAPLADCHVEDTRAIMGNDFWPYGFQPNVNLEHILALSLRAGALEAPIQTRGTIRS